MTESITVQIIEGPRGFFGHRDPRAADVPHLKCHDCEGPVFIRWFNTRIEGDDKLCGYSCDDEGCWPVALAEDMDD